MTSAGPPSGDARALPPVMTLAQAAEHLGVEAGALSRSTGLRTLNVLGDELVLRADLEGWLAARATPRA